MQPADTVSTVIFDLGQVIVTFDHMDLCRRASECSPHPPEEVFERMFGSGLVFRFETGALSPEDFYREASTLLGMHITLERFKLLWNAIFTLNIETAAIIERLAHVKRVLLSNTNCWHFEYCRAHYPVLGRFDACVLSCEVGACKPERAIFDAALARAETPAQQCLFIDDIELYTETARNMGIRSHTFTSAGRLETFLSGLGLL